MLIKNLKFFFEKMKVFLNEESESKADKQKKTGFKQNEKRKTKKLFVVSKKSLKLKMKILFQCS